MVASGAGAGAGAGGRFASNSRTVFVGGLPALSPGSDLDDLRALLLSQFAPYGGANMGSRDVTVFAHKKFAFIACDSEDSVDAACRELNGISFVDQRLGKIILRVAPKV